MQGGFSVLTPCPPIPLSSPPPFGWLLFPLPREPPFEPPRPFFIAPPALAGADSTTRKARSAKQRRTTNQCFIAEMTERHIQFKRGEERQAEENNKPVLHRRDDRTPHPIQA